MPIQVTCPHCLKRFQVSDKFAGKSGPCPSCKKQITVPDKSEEVVIHAPEDGAPKDRTGQSVLKPIVRKETDVTKKGMFITIGAILFTFALAFGFRMTGGESGVPLIAQIVGLLLLAPPLVWAGYSLLYDQECEPYVGAELRNRVLVCSLIFAVIWLIYAFVPAYVFQLRENQEMPYWLFGVTLCAMIGLGALASAASFELEFGSGVIHSGMYFIAIVLLAVVSGVTLAGQEQENPLLQDRQTNTQEL